MTTGAERKRRWREANPERSAAYEAERAEARRNGYWGRWELGKPKPRECLSSDSYYRYEWGIGRTLAQLKWSGDRRRARYAALLAAERQEAAQRPQTPSD